MRIGVHAEDYFVTRIWRFDLSELEPEFPAWRQSIQQLRDSSPDAQGRSNRLGWNSETNLFESGKFTSLEQAAQQCFIHCFKEMGIEVDEHAFNISAWVNLTYPGGYNVQHGHQRAYLSGCFYLDTPENCGRIAFADPRPAAAYSPTQMKGEMSTERVKIEPVTGHLLVFPSWLEHSVELNESTLDRVSIAMNVVEPS